MSPGKRKLLRIARWPRMNWAQSRSCQQCRHHRWRHTSRRIYTQTRLPKVLAVKIGGTMLLFGEAVGEVGAPRSEWRSIVKLLCLCANGGCGEWVTLRGVKGSIDTLRSARREVETKGSVQRSRPGLIETDPTMQMAHQTASILGVLGAHAKSRQRRGSRSPNGCFLQQLLTRPGRYSRSAEVDSEC